MLHIVHAFTQSPLTVHTKHLQLHNIASGEYTQHCGCWTQMYRTVQELSSCLHGAFRLLRPQEHTVASKLGTGWTVSCSLPR